MVFYIKVYKIQAALFKEVMLSGVTAKAGL